MKSLRDILLPVLSDIGTGDKIIEVSELWGASKALFLFGLQRESNRPVLVVTASEDSAGALIEDLTFFLQNMPRDAQGKAALEIRMFPSWRVLPFEADSPDSRTVGERMRFLYCLISGSPGIYVAPVQALMQKLPPWELFADSVKTITPTARIEPDDIVASLVATGYEPASLVTRVGEFSRRGGIIDFFSPLHDSPVRMEFFGDTIESLRAFDPESQRSTGELKEAVVLPVRELIVKRPEPSDVSGPVRLCQTFRLSPGSEFLAPFFYDMEDLFRYVPGDSLFVRIEPDDIKKEIGEQGRKIEEGRTEETQEGRVLPEAREMYLDEEGIMAGLSRFPVVDISLLGTGAGYRMDTKSSSWLGVRLTKPLPQDTRTRRAGRRHDGRSCGETEAAAGIQPRRHRLRHR